MAALSEIVGDSAPIVALREQARRLLERSSNVRRLRPILILGETGTGKGLLARAIHGASSRAAGPLVEVNCAAIPENLLEAEMFGVERGAFTDARQTRPGFFQAAHGGTLFLDEIGLMSLALQGKLLKALEDGVVRRVGGTRSEPVDVALVSATSADLDAAVREHRFREDLYHRLAVFVLKIPPLRERGDDVLSLAEHFLARCCSENELPAQRLSESAREALRQYPWSGNVRQLKNKIEAACLLTDGDRVEPEALELGAPSARGAMPAAAPEPSSLEAAVARTEREHLLAALERTGWNITRTAAALGLSRDTLRYRVEKHRLQPGTIKEKAQSKKREAKPRPTSSVLPSQAEADAPTTIPALRRSVSWTRRRVTVLRLTLNSTGSIPPLKDLERSIEKIETFGGHLEEAGASGLLAVFGLEPVEDAAQRAGLAALAIRNELERQQARRHDVVPYRIAIHAGYVLLGGQADSPRIDLADKRRVWQVVEDLAANAEPGTIVTTEATSPLLRRFELLPATGPGSSVIHRLTGREHAQFELERRASHFVGREREIDLLVGALAVAVEGRGQPIGIVGEAGIGKSRLLLEFRSRLGSGRIEWLHARCVSHGTSTPYLPLRAIVRQAFTLTDDDDAGTAEHKIREGLEDVDLDTASALPSLLHLLGMGGASTDLADLSPEALRDRIFSVLLDLVVARSRRRTLVLVMEDLHWIDRSSEAWVARLAGHVARTPILFVAAYRPGYRPSWLDRSDATQIALQPLGRGDGRAIIEPLLPPGAGVHLADRILDRAEGNPFFLEELALSVRERADAASDIVPETVEEVLRTRIDRLPDEPRRLLDAAAVLGRAAPAPLLHALWEGPSAPDPHLRELARLELLHEEGRSEGTAYVFRHALLQDVTYRALPVERRRALHAAAAAALERRDPERAAEVADQLAHHYSRADVGDKAVQYLSLAAENAARVFAYAEAAAALKEALVHVEKEPAGDRDRRALTLVLRQAYMLNFLGRFPEIVALLEQHAARVQRLGDPSFTGPYHFWLAHTASLMGDPARTVEHGNLALAEATRASDEATMGKACYALAYECFWSGRPREGVAHARDAIAHLERADDPWWFGDAHWVLGINHLLAGDFEPALAAERRTVEAGDAIGDPRLQSIGTSTIGAAYVLMGEWEAGIKACRRGLELSRDPVNSATTTGFLAGALLEKGDVEEAIPMLEQAATLCGRVGVRQTEAWFTAQLGEALSRSGQHERARELATRALERLTVLRYAYGKAWAERTLGRIALTRDDPVEARPWLERALASFTAIDAAHEVGRTHLDLAKLARAEKRSEQAAEHLRAALARFEELRVPRYVELAKMAMESA
jgi:DNA-binding NtrC family response regulator/tetratricopeptide (TPR) repeat protein